uniref:Reticulocalbin-3 n=1 Tax=Myotis lucifugus TaxID=59463 RepID=G1Q868_MYOLU
EFHDVEDAETYKKMLARDERRFRVADQDGDSMATREELTAFLHPEEFPHMRDIVVAETLEDLDKNKDGYIQVDEYIENIFMEQTAGRKAHFCIFTMDLEREEERNLFFFFCKKELEHHSFLPRNGNTHTQLPPTTAISYREWSRDGRLSKAEILGNWNMFVGSQATNYGEDLTRHHDEL